MHDSCTKPTSKQKTHTKNRKTTTTGCMHGHGSTTSRVRLTRGTHCNISQMLYNAGQYLQCRTVSLLSGNATGKIRYHRTPFVLLVFTPELQSLHPCKLGSEVHVYSTKWCTYAYTSPDSSPQSTAKISRPKQLLKPTGSLKRQLTSREASLGQMISSTQIGFKLLS